MTFTDGFCFASGALLAYTFWSLLVAAVKDVLTMPHGNAGYEKDVP